MAFADAVILRRPELTNAAAAPPEKKKGGNGWD